MPGSNDNRALRVASVHFESRRADKEANFGKIEHFTKQAVVEGARLTAAS